jgi:hypothetical protein
MANEPLFLFSLGLNIWVIIEALQVAFYGYGFAFRLLAHQRDHLWLPALFGMAVTGLAVAIGFILSTIAQTEQHVVDPWAVDVIAVLLLIGYRLKIVTIWRIEYGFGKWVRIRCAVAEVLAVTAITLFLHFYYHV